jgi:hypothetical protein
MATQYDQAEWLLDRFHPSKTIVFYEQISTTNYYATVTRVTNNTGPDVFVRTNLDNIIRVEKGTSVDVSSMKIEVFVPKTEAQVSGTYQLICCGLAQGEIARTPHANEEGASS